MKTFSEQTYREVVALAQGHYDHDQVVQGSYGSGDWGTDGFKGCTIGCLVNGDHKALEKWGIPESIGQLADNIFESLPSKKDASRWHVDWISAVPTDTDITLVEWQFLYWLIHDPVDGVVAIATDDVKAVINKHESLLRGAARGDMGDPDEWKQAAEEARAAWTAGTTREVWTARAAWVARAARAAWAARVAWEARSVGTAEKQAAKLLELLRAA